MTAATHVQPVLSVKVPNSSPLVTPQSASVMTTAEEVAHTLSDLPLYVQRRPPSPTSTVTPEPSDTLVSADDDLSESALTTGSVCAAHAATSPKLTKKSPVSALSCSNCGTNSTPLWRRNEQGQSICNACGLYYRAYGKVRPYWLKRNNGRKRGGNQEGKGGKDAGRGTSTEDASSSFSAQSAAKPGVATPASPEQQAAVDPAATTTGTCPGDGHCNGTGGSAACGGCPAFNQTHMSRLPSKCFNCQTDHTPLWRRDAEGNTICNACGLYYKLHNVHRPVHMRRNVIKRRKRTAHSTSGKDSPPSESRSPAAAATSPCSTGGSQMATIMAHDSQGLASEPQSRRRSSLSVSPILPLASTPGDVDVPPVSVPRAMANSALPKDVPAIEDTLPRRKRSYGHMNAASVNIQIDDSYTRYPHHLHDALHPPPAKLPALVSGQLGHGLDRPAGGMLEEHGTHSSDGAPVPMAYTQPPEAPRSVDDRCPVAHIYARPLQASPRDERYHHPHSQPHDPMVPGAGVSLPPIRDSHPLPGSDARHPHPAPTHHSRSQPPLGDSLAAYAHDNRAGASYATHHVPDPVHQPQSDTSSVWQPQDVGRLAFNREEMMLHRQELQRENERLQALLSRTASMIHELDHALQDCRGSEMANSPSTVVGRSPLGPHNHSPSSPPAHHHHHHHHHHHLQHPPQQPQDYPQPSARRPSSQRYSSPPSPVEISATPGQQHSPRPHLPSLRNILPNPASPPTAPAPHGPLASRGGTSHGISSRS